MKDYLTNEEKIDLIDKAGFKYISGNITNGSKPLHIQCKKNNHDVTRSFYSIKQGNIQCPYCNNRVPRNYWNQNTCQKWLDENLVGYKILDSKKGSRGLEVYVQCNCPSHSPFWARWSHIVNDGSACKMCYYDSNGKSDWTKEKAILYFAENGYKMVNENDYKSSHTLVYCYDELNFIYKLSVHTLLRGQTNYSLFKGNNYSLHNLRRYCELYRPDYEVISDTYIGYRNKHKFSHNGSGLPEGESREFEMSIGNFVASHCKHPRLSKSNMETICEHLLLKYNVPFETQKTFPDCVYKKRLKFDFYIELNDERICIETDGEQHDRPIKYFGGQKTFELQQIKDKIKDEYCKNNNIRLIRIPANKFKNIESILVNELNLDLIDQNPTSNKSA